MSTPPVVPAQTNAPRTPSASNQQADSTSSAQGFETALDGTAAAAATQELSPTQQQVVEETAEVIEEVEEAVADVEEMIEVIAQDETVATTVVAQQKIEQAREMVEETKEKLEEIKDEMTDEPEKITQEDLGRLRHLLGKTAVVGGNLATYYGSTVTTSSSWLTGGINGFAGDSEDEALSKDSSTVETSGMPNDGFYLSGNGLIDLRTIAFDAADEFDEYSPVEEFVPVGPTESQHDAKDRISESGVTQSSTKLDDNS